MHTRRSVHAYAGLITANSIHRAFRQKGPHITGRGGTTLIWSWYRNNKADRRQPTRPLHDGSRGLGGLLETAETTTDTCSTDEIVGQVATTQPVYVPGTQTNYLHTISDGGLRADADPTLSFRFSFTGVTDSRRMETRHVLLLDRERRRKSFGNAPLIN